MTQTIQNQVTSFFVKSVTSSVTRKKIFYTALVLFVFRLVAHIPAAGINRGALQALFLGSPILSVLDIFSGGTLANFSILALGLTPYINASIVLQLLSTVIPSLELLREEGELGQEKLNQYTRFLTLPLAILQSFAMYALLKSQSILFDLSPIQLVALVATMTAGTMFSIWLGELITEYGLGNGVSFLIFAGIVARLPVSVFRQTSTFEATDLFSTIALVVVGVGIVALIVFVNEAVRHIPIQYARQAVKRVPGASSSFIPLRVNQVGVMPIIFALSLVLIPSFLGQVLSTTKDPNLVRISQDIVRLFNPQSGTYNVMYFLLVVGFTYFYTSVVFNPDKIAGQLQKSGAFIPGIRPGSQTTSYLTYVLNRVTLIGAVFLGLIAILPSLLQQFIGVSNLVIGGTGVLIVVSVVLEITRDIESRLITNRYDKFV